MILSATIPPAVAEGLFATYHDGYRHFSRFRSRPDFVTAFWADEFSAKVERVTERAGYQSLHDKFVKKRAKKLADSKGVARRMEIRGLPDAAAGTEPPSLASNWFDGLTSAAIELHHRHHTVDPRTNKRHSLDVIRVANVESCIAMARHLLEQSTGQTQSTSNVSIRVITYHARGVLLLRSELERYLDRVPRTQISVHPQNLWVKIRTRLSCHQTQSSPVQDVGFLGGMYSCVQ